MDLPPHRKVRRHAAEGKRREVASVKRDLYLWLCELSDSDSCWWALFQLLWYQLDFTAARQELAFVAVWNSATGVPNQVAVEDLQQNLDNCAWVWWECIPASHPQHAVLLEELVAWDNLRDYRHRARRPRREMPTPSQVDHGPRHDVAQGNLGKVENVSPTEERVARALEEIHRGAGIRR